MDDHLLGYLLETLDPATRQKVEAELQSSPDARARLTRIQAALAPLAEDAADPEPSPGLVLDTLARVAEYRCSRPKVAAPPARGDVPHWGLFRRADVLVAAAILFLALGILAPLLSRLWRNHDRYACANNLRKFWGGLSAYADSHEGEFPRIEETGPRSVAGSFVPALNEAGLLDGVSVTCPGRGPSKWASGRLGELERLYAERPDEFAVVARTLAGHYAYSLGYAEGHDQLRGLRRDSGDGLPILADQAGEKTANSDNHGGSGQNVLFVGGNVRWATLPTVGVAGDHIYLNQKLRREAGLCRVDTVLGASDARPYPD